MKFFNISFEKSVGAVVFREEKGDRKYLLLKYRSGQWDFPKGHVEEGETEKETALREIKEETGLTEVEFIEGFRIVNRFFYTARRNEYRERVEKGKGINIFKRAIYYLVKTREEKVLLDHENSEYAWVEFEKVLKMLSNNGSKLTIKKANSFRG